jgi:hypothetical protein
MVIDRADLAAASANAAVTGGTVAIPDDPLALEPSDRAPSFAETPIATSLPRGTLADMSAGDAIDQGPARSGQSVDTAPAAAEGPAMRDARSIAARIAADEGAADEARDAYQASGLPPIEPDASASAILKSGELLYAVRASALLEEAGVTDGERLPRGGTLYLTSARLIHVGNESTEAPLGEIDEMAVALERLVLIRLRDGSDLAVEVDQPRLLRVQIAAAIAALAGERSQQP